MNSEIQMEMIMGASGDDEEENEGDDARNSFPSNCDVHMQVQRERARTRAPPLWRVSLPVLLFPVNFRGSLTCLPWTCVVWCSPFERVGRKAFVGPRKERIHRPTRLSHKSMSHR